MSENQGNGDWLREPGPGEAILVAKAGEGVEFPDYVVSALKQYESELRSQQGPPSPELEATCTVKIDCKLSIM
jgi:hypothetical protein